MWMRPTRLLAAVTFCLLPASLSAQSRFDLHEVRWQMTPAENGETIAMSMLMKPLHRRNRIVVRIPYWRPGSYRFANYQENVQGLQATDQDGHRRKVLRLNPRTWEIECDGTTSLEVSYVLKVQNSADEGNTPVIHLHGPATFLYTDDSLELSHTLRVNLPADWDFASGHRPDPGESGIFRSPNYDVFADCPMLLGGLERFSFSSHDTPFEVVLGGKMPTEKQFDRQDWVQRVQRICESSRTLVGPYPFERYVFLYVFNDIGGGYGLEHLNSTTIMWNHRSIKAGRLSGLESVTAHEFFHLWNVKRIRPQQLGPFRYDRDVHTEDLWWLEGVTDYYTDVILQRAGMRQQQSDWLFQEQAANYRSIRAQSGFGRISPARASWTVWNRSPSNYVSYYDSGRALGFLLDLKIRIETQNRRSLDDVVRFLHRWVDYPNQGYRPGDLERAIFGVTGWQPTRFFDRYVRGHLGFPFQEICSAAGLQVVQAERGSPIMGFDLDSELRVIARSSLPDGLQAGDRLLSFQGVVLQDRDHLRRLLAKANADGPVGLRVQRGESALELQIPVKARNRFLFRIEVDPEAPEAEVQIREGLLNGFPQGV